MYYLDIGTICPAMLCYYACVCVCVSVLLGHWSHTPCNAVLSSVCVCVCVSVLPQHWYHTSCKAVVFSVCVCVSVSVCYLACENPVYDKYTRTHLCIDTRDTTRYTQSTHNTHRFICHVWCPCIYIHTSVHTYSRTIPYIYTQHAPYYIYKHNTHHSTYTHTIRIISNILQTPHDKQNTHNTHRFKQFLNHTSNTSCFVCIYVPHMFPNRIHTQHTTFQLHLSSHSLTQSTHRSAHAHTACIIPYMSPAQYTYHTHNTHRFKHVFHRIRKHHPHIIPYTHAQHVAFQACLPQNIHITHTQHTPFQTQTCPASHS